MSPSNTEIATALLELEEIHKSQGLDAAQLREWNKMVFQLLALICKRGEQRHDLRFAASGSVAMRNAQGELVGELLDVNKESIGVLLAGASLDIGDEVTLEKIDFQGDSITIDCSARVARADGNSIAIELEDDQAAKKKLFDHLYYPLYLGYLRKLAQA